MNLRHFTLDEFDSPDSPGSGELMDTQFLMILDEIREICAFPFIVTSGFRTPSHNKSVGGKANSAHLRGHAADISVIDDHRRFELIKVALYTGIQRLEIGSNWVHLDNDPSLPQGIINLP